MITVFYDGQCGLCSKEIEYYRKIAPKGIFSWKEIAESKTELQHLGITVADSLRILHVKDARGTLHKGVDAFVIIWAQLKVWWLLGRFVSVPVVRSFANILYEMFANWRFKRLKHCQIATKKNKFSLICCAVFLFI